MIKVYIASPYTLGDVSVNVRVSFDAAAKLRTLGYMPIAPLRSHFEHMMHPQAYEVWMTEDKEYVAWADVLLRLPGDSPGADREVVWAKKWGKPVVCSVDELEKIYDRKRDIATG